jgi:hypothetical protein
MENERQIRFLDANIPSTIPSKKQVIDINDDRTPILDKYVVNDMFPSIILSI